MKKYIVHSKPGCYYCDMTKMLLNSMNAHYETITYETKEQIETFKSKGFTTFPQIYEDGTLIGGYTDLVEYLKDPFE